MPGLTSATGVLGFLADEEIELKVFALQTLNDDIDTVWTEVAVALSQIEALYEDRSFPQRELAALVLSKVYYHLQDYHESMTFALAAGDLFTLDDPGEFEETIISRCVDQYIAVSSAHRSANPKPSPRNGALPALVTSFSHIAGETSVLISPTTPFSQTSLPPKSLLSRMSTKNAILDPSFQTNVKGLRSGSVLSSFPNQATHSALLRIIKRLFESCLHQGCYQQVLGIAVEAKDLDVLRNVIRRANQDEGRYRDKASIPAVPGDPSGAALVPAASVSHGPAEELMEYALSICMDLVQERSFRTEMLRLILDLLHEIPNPDYFSIARCVVHLNADEEASRMLRKLVGVEARTLPESAVIAYQIAFDLYDNGTQEFLSKVIRSLPIDRLEEVDAVDRHGEIASGAEEGSEGSKKAADGTTIATGSKSSVTVFRNIGLILDGSLMNKLTLEFLYRNNHTDIGILNKVRDSLESRSSIFHTAVSLCNGFMNQGTTNDRFFRDNLEWLGKAVNWSKFTATAALGVIHRGNVSQARKLLEPYLPKSQALSSGSPFSQGGALYAYGLIHANHGTDALDFLNQHFAQAEDEVILHGGALGLGIAGIATGSDSIFQNLRLTMFTDSALNGEAVGLAMGLIMLGTGRVQALEDMVKYAHETNHEKSVRGLAIGMALVMYGRQEGADVLTDGLLRDPDSTLRYGGVLMVAMAYCGTGSNKAVRKLLHLAVSDVSDDVRRMAVMSLGFILFRRPGSVPRMVELLSESYNPHVRYGSAMALGISCAGTGLDEAVDLLEPMMKDPTDFVRQGALIALAMIMIQQNEVMNPRVSSIRKTFRKIVGDRHEDALTKFGATLALGIIDAGGRNCTIGLQTQTGSLNMAGIVGMAVFIQYWYWLPFSLFLSLSFSPTSMIGLDHDLEMPELQLHCAARPSLFDYPPEQEIKAEEGPAMIATAILSTTAQARRRAQMKERAARRESMDIDPPTAATSGGDTTEVAAAVAPQQSSQHEEPTTGTFQTATNLTATAVADDGDRMEIDENGSKVVTVAETEAEAGADSIPLPASTGTESRKKAWEKEKAGYEIENMSRVLPGQMKYISFPAGRYKPVKKPTGGPILLYDLQPQIEKKLIEEKLKKASVERSPLANGDAGGASAPFRGAGAGAGASASDSSRTFSDLSSFLGQAHSAPTRPRSGMISRRRGGETTDAARQQQRSFWNLAANGIAAGVLTAVDEDGAEDDEADMPREFDYYTDSEE